MKTPAHADNSGVHQAIRSARGDWWYEQAQLAIRQLAAEGRGFDVDHLIDLVGEPPAPEYVGAALAAAHRSKHIEAVGARVARDGRLLRIWWPLQQEEVRAHGPAAD